ncbi:ADP-ribosylglycohydrolase family protein [Arthrobacter pigmenti]
MLGGALADALGNTVGSSTLQQAGRYSGSADPADFAVPAAAWFSDETQLCLYSVDGLLEALRWANDGVPADETACVWLAYLRWLRTQGVPLPESAPHPPEQWLDRQAVMQHRADPDEACLTGLASGDMGSQARPVNPQARGAGAVVRSAPFGLLPYVGAETVFKLSRDTAALTHGHPSAVYSAAALSLIVHHLVHDGGRLAEAAGAAMAHLEADASAEPEVLRMLADVRDLAAGEPLSPEQLTAEFGAGASAVEVLAIGLYSALAAEALGDEMVGGQTAGNETRGSAMSDDDPGQRFRRGIAVAINHDGQSDAAGSIAGNLLGARYGDQVVPSAWLEALQGREVIYTLADSLVDATFGP